MKETVLTFLTRIAFLLGDSTKDPDAPALLKHSLGLLDDALVLWPSIPVKMNFLNRMLETNLQQNVDPPPSLIIGEPHRLNTAISAFSTFKEHAAHAAGYAVCSTGPTLCYTVPVTTTRSLDRVSYEVAELALPSGVRWHASGISAGLQVWR